LRPPREDPRPREVRTIYEVFYPVVSPFDTMVQLPSTDSEAGRDIGRMGKTLTEVAQSEAERLGLGRVQFHR